MRNHKLTAIFVCATLALGTSAAVANAAESASADTCMSMAATVKTALDSNQQSSNYDAARKQKNYGMQFCSHDMYQTGMDHYAQALKLLGVSQS